MPILVSSGARRRAVLVAALLAAACGGNDGAGPNQNPNNNPPPAADPNTDINIVEGASTRTTTAFNPNPKTVSLGGNASVSVRWINGDITGGDYQQGTATVHNIVSDNGAFPSSGNLGGNATHSVTLSAAGNYDYHCSIHAPFMVGTITVNP
jgi:plastocyanin